jgi:phenylacetate-CoA oxygenase PaaI subunit
MSAVAELPIEDELRAALAAFVRTLADNKVAVGRRYGEWAVSAPTLESGVAAAAMAQDELGHARSTYPLLGQLGFPSPDEDRMEAAGCLPLLAEPLASWEMFVAVNLVVDGTLTALVRAVSDSGFVPLADRARKILQEERSHAVHARAWARRLGCAGDGTRETFATAIDECWTAVAALAGKDEAIAALGEADLMRGSAEGLREEVRGTVTEALLRTQVHVALQ